MGSKLKFVIPVAIFAVFLLVVGGFAVLTSSTSLGEFSVSDSVLTVNIADGSGINLGNFSTRTTITNNATYDINLTIDSNLSTSTFFNASADGIVYNNTIVIGANTNRIVYFKFNSLYPVGSYLINVNISNTTNATENVTLPITLTIPSGLNVTIISAQDTTGSVNLMQSGNNISAYVIVAYWNGTYASGLTKENFIFSMLHTNSAILSGKDSDTINVSSIEDTGTYYALNTSITNDTLLGGNYTLTVSASADTNTGFSTYNNFSIDQTALQLTTTSCAGGTLYIGNSTVCKFNVTNYGYKTSGKINITYTNKSSCISPDPVYSNVSNSFANMATYVNNTTVTGVSTNAACMLNVTAYSSSSSDKWDVQTLSEIQFAISVLTTTPTPVVTTPTSPSNNFIPSNEKHLLTVTPPSTIEIVQGGSASKTISVKNTGTYIEKGVGLTVSGIDASWYTISTGAQLFSTGVTKNYDVTFNIPKTAEPKTYTITFTAKGDTVSATGTSTLKITPTVETQNQIKANLTAYKSEYDNVLGIYNSSLASGKNVSNINDTINQLTGLFTKADSLIGEGKYTEAYETLKQIKTLLTQAQETLAIKSGMALQINPEMIVGGIAALALLGIIVYFAKNRDKIPKMPKMKLKLPDKKTITKPNNAPSFKQKFSKNLYSKPNDGFADKLKDKLKRK